MTYRLKLTINKIVSMPSFRWAHITLKRLIRKNICNIDTCDELLLFHKNNIEQYNGNVALEIGTGASLFYHIMLSNILTSQYLYDISILVDKNSINYILNNWGK